MIKTAMAIIVMLVMISPALAGEMHMSQHMMGHNMMSGMDMHKSGISQTDNPRISLNLPAPMRLNQLMMMREHLQAVDEIVADIAEGKFDAASEIAHKKLGLTPEMRKMCDMLGRKNSDFRTIGLAFHNSADALGDTLKTGNIQHSLAALHRTMNYCIQCHATFQQ